MPSKTIYVSTVDLPLFERAAELGGGLSPAIATALREYIQRQEAAVRGYHEVQIVVSDEQIKVHKRFMGRRLARVSLPRQGLRAVRFDVYETQRGQYAVHTRDVPDWNRASRAPDDAWDDPATWSGEWTQPAESRLDVFAAIDDLEGHVPDEVLTAVHRAQETPTIEELDI